MQARTAYNVNPTMQLNVAMYRYLGEIAADENLMAKAVKYVQKLAAKKEQANETEYIMSSPRMVEIMREGDEEIARGQVQPIALDDLWK